MRLRRLSSKRSRRRLLPAPTPARDQSTPSAALADQPRRPSAGPGFVHLWLQRIGVIILSVAVLVSVVNVLSLSTDTKVVPLTAAGSRSFLRPTAVYAAAANRQLSSSIWSRNKITVNTSRLSHELLNQFPELSSVSVTVPLLAHRPVVYVATAQPALILATGSGSFVVDTTGKALIAGANPASLNQPNLPLLNDQSGLHIQANHQALPATNVGFIQVVIAQLAAKQFAVSGMTLPPAASELDVHLNGQPYFIKFNLESDQPREQAGTFLATIAQLRRQNITPGQYVDVRVPGRAYYK